MFPFFQLHSGFLGNFGCEVEVGVQCNFDAFIESYLPQPLTLASGEQAKAVGNNLIIVGFQVLDFLNALNLHS